MPMAPAVASSRLLTSHSAPRKTWRPKSSKKYQRRVRRRRRPASELFLQTTDKEAIGHDTKGNASKTTRKKRKPARERQTKPRIAGDRTRREQGFSAARILFAPRLDGQPVLLHASLQRADGPDL